jgi:hypothetical protein
MVRIYYLILYKGDTDTTRMLVKSRDGELLMVRRQVFSPIRSKPYTMSVKVVKADVNIGGGFQSLRMGSPKMRPSSLAEASANLL